MFSSIKIKIIFFITMVMVLTAVINIFFTQRDVGNAMIRSQEHSVQKVLDYVNLNTKEEYRRLLSGKIEMTFEKKKLLKATALTIRSVFASFDGIAETGSGGSGRLKESAADWIDRKPDKTITSIVLDRNAQLVATDEEDFSLEAFTSLTDIKGRRFSDIIPWDSLSERGDYAVLNTDTDRKLFYFLPFSRWQYTIVTAIDIGDIELEAGKQLERIIKALNTVAGELVTIDGGFSFMFDQNQNFLIEPSDEIQAALKFGTNLYTGNPILEDMMQAARSEDTKMIHVLAGDPEKKKMSTILSYFGSLDWYIGVSVPYDEIRRPARELVLRQSLIISLILIAGVLVVYWIVARIASPINQLAQYAKELARQDFTSETRAESPIQNLPAKYRDEVGKLAKSFIFMENELRENIHDLLSVTAAREKIQSELNVAHEIQMGIVPKTFPTFPQYEEFDLFATLKPAREVGGDLYDFFLVDDSHLCFTLGDVSDKGVPAALFMVITRTLIKTSAEKESSPAKIMETINSLLAADNPRSMFVTLIIGMFNFKTGEIVYANGGHNPPVIIPEKEKPYFKTGKVEPIVGVMEGMPYSDHTISLEPGDGILLYTDGVTEAMNETEECFSDEKLLETLTPDTYLGKDISNVVAAVMGAVEAHSGEAPQSDDIAMLAIRYIG